MDVDNWVYFNKYCYQATYGWALKACPLNAVYLKTYKTFFLRFG